MLAVLNYTSRVISPSGLDALPGTMPQKEESKGVRSDIARPNSLRAPAKSWSKALPPSIRTFLKSTFWIVASRTRGKRPIYGMSTHWSALLKVMGIPDRGQ